jgi:hypothetical protein
MDAAGRSGQNIGAARNTVFLFFGEFSTDLE